MKNDVFIKGAFTSIEHVCLGIGNKRPLLHGTKVSGSLSEPGV